jgi:peptidoglycan/LPS O-acetylase OafA/YrhL
VVARNLLYYHQILVGCLLALALDDRPLFDRLRRLVGRGRLLTVLFLAVHLAEPRLAGPARDLARLLYPTLTAGLLAALVLGVGPAPLLAWRPLAFVGQLSYGGYLVHVLVFAAVYRAVPWLLHGPAVSSVVAVGLTAAGSIAAAWVLRLLVEQPGIRLGRLLSDRLQGEGPLPLKGSAPALS